MTQYIDKSTLSADIDKRKNLCEKIVLDLRTKENKDYYQGKAEAYSEMSELIDTLEVKEVDLEKEYKDFVEEDPVYNKLANGIVGKAIAKHFFELGLKAQHSELTWEDISVLRKIMAEYRRQTSNEMLVLNDEDYCKEVLNRFKAQKGK